MANKNIMYRRYTTYSTYTRENLERYVRYCNLLRSDRGLMKSKRFYPLNNDNGVSEHLCEISAFLSTHKDLDKDEKLTKLFVEVLIKYTKSYFDWTGYLPGAYAEFVDVVSFKDSSPTKYEEDEDDNE